MKQWLTKKITRPRLDAELQKYASEAKTLDIGGAAGHYKTYFPNAVVMELFKGPGVDVVADVQDMPFEENTFDIILCVNVLGHVQNPMKAAEEMKRVLKPGGIIIVNFAFFFTINETPTDYWRFTPQCAELLFAPFKKKEFKPLFGEIETIAVILQRLAIQSVGSKWKKGVYAILARLLFLLNLDRWIDQRAYNNMDKEKVMESMMSAVYFGVYEK